MNARQTQTHENIGDKGSTGAVSSEINALDDELGQLFERINDLDKRLTDVTTPQAPMGNSVEETECSEVRMVQTLSQLRLRTQTMISRLADLFERIQV